MAGSDTEKCPVLFYFWTQGSHEEWNTEILGGLVSRADSVFLEFVSPNTAWVSETENYLNQYIAGIIPPKLAKFDKTPARETQYLLGAMKGTGKRIILGGRLKAPFDYSAERDKADRVFYTSPLEKALEAKAAFLEKGEAYNKEREAHAAARIASIDGACMVIYDAGHPELAELVSLERPVEVYYPYEGYENSFETQMRMDFRNSGKLNEELFLRHHMEGMARGGLMAGYGSHHAPKISYLSHRYASIMTPDKILGYRDYLVFLSGIASLKTADVFESFLKKEGILLPAELMEESTRDAHKNENVVLRTAKASARAG